MSDKSAIEWTDATWNPTTGCMKVSPGCANCYIETTTPFRVQGRKFVAGAIPIRLHHGRLEQPLRWKKGKRIFVNSLSDLFHEDIPDEFIDRVFAVMALTGQHTYQVLTKRPARMLTYLTARAKSAQPWKDAARTFGHALEFDGISLVSFPLPNVWLGVSGENQRMLDSRVPLLLQTPAAVRFVSCEPLLEPISFRWAKWDDQSPNPRRKTQLSPVERDGRTLAGAIDHLDGLRMLDWIIFGGESGTYDGARPTALEWIERGVEECLEAGVPVFVKQLGTFVVSEARTIPLDTIRNKELRDPIPCAPNGEAWAWRAGLKHRKGGDIAEFPSHLRIRQFPEARA